MTHVLFVCVGNQGRSVMAERLFREAAGAEHETRSAGAAPGRRRSPRSCCRLGGARYRCLRPRAAKLDDDADRLGGRRVAACDGVCPVVPGKRNENWHLPDPMGLPLGEVRVIRDEIKRRVDTLLDELTASA